MTVPLTPLDDRCEAVSDDGFRCILRTRHDFSHQRYPCNGTCDTCECDFEFSYADDAGLFDDEDVEWCLDCGDTFRYDDIGGYNPPCHCGAKCRSCCDHECEREPTGEEPSEADVEP